MRSAWHAVMPDLNLNLRRCICGCGEDMPIPDSHNARLRYRNGTTRYIMGHQPRKLGHVPVMCWGYRLMPIGPEHQFVSMGQHRAGVLYVPEHRLVYAEHLGRPLRTDEVIHHIDGNKTNNVIGNLELTNQPDHMREHNRLRRLVRPGVCQLGHPYDEGKRKCRTCHNARCREWYARNKRAV